MSSIESKKEVLRGVNPQAAAHIREEGQKGREAGHQQEQLQGQRRSAEALLRSTDGAHANRSVAIKQEAGSENPLAAKSSQATPPAPTSSSETQSAQESVRHTQSKNNAQPKAPADLPKTTQNGVKSSSSRFELPAKNDLANAQHNLQQLQQSRLPNVKPAHPTQITQDGVNAKPTKESVVKAVEGRMPLPKSKSDSLNELVKKDLQAEGNSSLTDSDDSVRTALVGTSGAMASGKTQRESKESSKIDTAKSGDGKGESEEVEGGRVRGVLASIVEGNKNESIDGAGRFIAGGDLIESGEDDTGKKISAAGVTAITDPDHLSLRGLAYATTFKRDILKELGAAVKEVDAIMVRAISERISGGNEEDARLIYEQALTQVDVNGRGMRA